MHSCRFLPWVITAALGCGPSETTEVTPASGTQSSSGAGSSGGSSSSADSTGSGVTTESTDPMCGNAIVEGDEACDDMNADALDGCLSDCTPGPNGIARSPGLGLDYQGVGGGVRYDDICPEGEVMIGLRGQWQSAVERIQVVCGRIDVTELDGEWTLSVTEATVLPQRGTADGTTFDATCPSGHAMVGFSGRADQQLDAVGVSCAPLSIRTLEGQPTIDVDLDGLIDVEVVGASGGDEFGPLLCGPGQIVTSALIRAAGHINGLGLGCSAIAFG